MKYHILIALMLSLASWNANAAKRPNILLIMADDLGAENLACYGNTVYSTPNLDRLAAEGARFANAYATPVCTPTRAMILTGLHPNRSGFLERLDSPLDPERNNRLPVHLKTFGHVFQAAGYATAIAGKWHLGDFEKHPDQPTTHGFDEHCLWVQYWDGGRRSRYFGPHNWENGKYKVHDNEVFGPDYYCDFLIDFMERNHKQERPFLAYFPMNLIHGPLITPPGDQMSAEAGYPADLGKKERINGRMVQYLDKIIGGSWASSMNL
jgi:arylsulfatase A